MEIPNYSHFGPRLRSEAAPDRKSPPGIRPGTAAGSYSGHLRAVP
jgi:hypothetical protein